MSIPTSARRIQRDRDFRLRAVQRARSARSKTGSALSGCAAKSPAIAGPHPSGHVYFSLKDANAQLDAVIWRSIFQRMRVKPQEGLEVVATGKITTFPGQVVLPDHRRADRAGGRRRADGAAGGAPQGARGRGPVRARAQAAAALSCRASIGVVTSPTGAVIRDILHRLAERFPLACAGLAGARAGRDGGGGSRRRDRRLQRAVRRRRRSRGRTC